MHSRVVLRMAILARDILEHYHRGQMKEFCQLISDMFFLFFIDICGGFLIFNKSFQKPKGRGGP